MKKLMLVLVVLFFGFPAFAQNTANLLNNYLNVKNALVNGDSKAASEATTSLYESIKKKIVLTRNRNCCRLQKSSTRQEILKSKEQN